MSHRPHPLRQSFTLDTGASLHQINRYPSTTSSSASSGYSYSSGASDAYGSTASSVASMTYGDSRPSSQTHRRGKSEAVLRHVQPKDDRQYPVPPANQDSTFSLARQSLKPLPQPPADGPPSARTPPRPDRHERGKSFDIGRLSISDDRYSSKTSSPRPLPQAPGPVSPVASPTTPPRPHRQSRGLSVDFATTSPEPTSPGHIPRHLGGSRPNSMVLTRSDAILQTASPTASSPGAVVHSPFRPDLRQLGRSSTSQLRTLSTLAQTSGDDPFSITAPVQEVVGLRGRRKLQRSGDAAGAKRSDRYGFEGRNWMDKQRQFLQAYEYLCHIGEAKEWIEDIIQRQIPPIVELEEALRNGVTLAEVVEALEPNRRYRIFRNDRLQARHWENVHTFFKYLDQVEMPDLFRFELIDLYEKKNIPKVIYCVHALSWLLFRKGIVDFRIGNLVGQLEFEPHELEATQKGLDKLGINMPSFGTMGADFGEPEEPAETEEERIDRELSENEGTIVELQAQMRGALLRLRLADTMEKLWDSEDWLVDLQSRIRGDFARQIVAYRMDMRKFAVNLQSSCRGFLVRQRMAKRDQAWKSSEKDVIKLQSMIRAIKVRQATDETRAQLAYTDGPIRSIQAAMRGFLVREKAAVQRQETAQLAAPTRSLQAAIRGMLARDRVSTVLDALDSNVPTITMLQSAARASLARSEIGRQQNALQAFAPEFTSIQALWRANKARKEVQSTQESLRKHTPELQILQGHARGAAVRRDIANLLDAIEEHEDSVVILQGMARGMLARQRIAADLDALDEQTEQITALQAHIRGSLLRQKNSAFLAELKSHETEVVSLQGFIRAMLLRCNVGDLLGELDAHDEVVTELQSLAKGFIVRAKFVEKQRHFHENMQKVVKIQSFVRAKLQGEAYKSLTQGKNPPVGAVKNFVHLLNDSDFDFNEEVEFERMRKTVVQQVRQNEMLEQYIDQLDIKIALLVKNKITLDEVVRHQSNYGGHASSLLANTSMSSTNHFDLKALNKSSRKKLELYQQLFFNLQTQPQYLARLFKRIREQGTAEKETKRIEHLMMGLFGYAQKRREEYYLLKLVARSIREEVDSCQTVQDYVRGNFFWAKLFSNYTRSPRDRKYLRDLLGPLVRDNIIEDPALDLESDPIQIYRSAISNEELRTGRPSHRPLDIPRDLAIKDPETRELFIDHLRDLREICDQYFFALEDLLQRMPFGLRFIAQQTFEALRQRFPREPPQQILQLVGSWVWRFYLQPALTNPEQVGVTEKSLSPLQKRNLGEVAKVLGQIVSGRPFGGDNIYLQPLNAFITESVERLHHINNDLITVADAESTFDIDEFNDLYAKNKPTLYIKMTDIFAIHTLIAQDLPVICPGRDDVLREIMQDLGSAKSNENEMIAAGSSDIQMFLTPKLHDVGDPDADVKALFMETKRCVLYIIRVQTGANLLEILVRPPTQQDEMKWQALLREDFASGSNTKGAYSDVNMVDVTRMSYFDMKRNALENIMHLEQMGRISKHNYYQDILNAIALDIRTKSRRRIQRQKELEGVRLTLGNLHEKAKYLEQQRKSYDDYIEQAMMTLQNKKGKKRFLMPFTRQYNHQRELERAGRVPKFGSYQYSVRQLADKGVVVEWQGHTEREWGSINLTISCDQVGVFNIEGSRNHIQIPGASAVVPIEDLLQAQFEAHQFITHFEGNLKLNVNLLLHLLYRKFYRTQ